MIGVSNITNRTDPNSLKSRVFVGNLNTVQMSKTELESIFSKYGAIVGISVHKGYAFIQYANEINARAAVNGEDSKAYYNMMLDVTIASEPKNRKRGRSNISTTIPACGLSELALQAQALNSLTGNPVLSLQQLGLEGIMGQPNLAQFAAAASSVLNSQSFSGLNVVTTTPSLVSTNTRQKFTRLSNPSTTSTSTTPMSFAAKRTRLEGGSGSSGGSSNLNLPLGARGQNLVSLVSPTESASAHNRSSHGRQSTSPAKGFVSNQTSTSHSANIIPNRTLSVARPTNSSNGSTAVRSSSSIPSVTSSSSSSSAQLAQRLSPGDSKSSMRSNRTPTLTTANAPFSSSQSSGFSHTGGAPSMEGSSPASASRYRTDDILICGRCRRLFEQVDELISHKMAGCSLGKDATGNCRCRAVGEPDSLDCVYCGATFYSAWELMHHCHSDHGLTIYTIPSPSASPAASLGSASSTGFSRGSRENCEYLDHRRKSPLKSANNKHQDNHSTTPIKLDSHSEDTREASDWDPEEQDDEPVEVGDDDAEEDAERDKEEEPLGSESDERTSTPTLAEKDGSNQTQPAGSPTGQSKSDKPNHELANTSSSDLKSQRPANGDSTDLKVEESEKRTKVKSDASPSRIPRRSRGGEYGRHETIEDEDDYEEEDDVVVLRSGEVEN